MNHTPTDRCAQMLKEAKETVKQPFPFEDVNLFSILNMENKEVSAHAAFLYYIFKPFIYNGQIYDINLRLLHKKLLQKTGRKYVEPQYINISREVATDFGRLDFLINYSVNGKENYYIIELKIRAGEQEKQIERYERYLKTICGEENTANRIFFLTPEPREAQTGNAVNITLKEDLNAVFESIKASSNENGYAKYAAVIEQYQDIIKNLSGEAFMENNHLFKSINDFKAAETIRHSQNVLITELLHEFLSLLKKEIMNHPNFKALSEYITEMPHSENFEKSDYKNYYRWGAASYPVIPFLLNKDKLKNDIKNQIPAETAVYFFIEIESNLYTGITLRKLRNNCIVADEISAELRNTLSLYDDGSRKTTPSFFRWEWIVINGRKINFTDYLNDDDGFLRFLKADSLEFDEVQIKRIANEAVAALSKEVRTYFVGI